MQKKITKQNIQNLIEGKTNQLLSFSGLLSETIEEQIEYRKQKCSDCRDNGACIRCGCSYPGRIYVTQSCNKDRFPDLMSDEEWIKFKENERS